MKEERTTIVEAWATKYRPRKFSDVAGQEDAVLRLRGMLKKRAIPNAILFAGPSGCGKTTLARLFARYVNCETVSACGKCPSCQEQVDNHPDVFETNAAGSRGIDDMRSLVQQAQFKPRHNMRVFILDEAHQLTPQAQQMMLKPLEEPPKRTMYIFCTTDPQKFPNAILTRCQRIEITPPSREDVVKRLNHIAEREKITFPKGVVEGAAELSGGSVRTAINLLEGAAQILAADPKIDPKKLLQRVSASAIPESSLIAAKVLLGMYLGKRKAVVSAIFDSQNAIELINNCLRANQYMIGCELAPESRGVWHTADLKKFRSLAKEKCGDKLTIDVLMGVQKKLTDVRAELQNFAVSELSLLLARLT